MDYGLLVRDKWPWRPRGLPEEGLVSTMTTRPMEPGPPQRRHGRARPEVDAGQLWAGGAATAVVAGLIALVGGLVCFKIMPQAAEETTPPAPAAESTHHFKAKK